MVLVEGVGGIKEGEVMGGREWDGFVDGMVEGFMGLGCEVWDVVFIRVYDRECVMVGGWVENDIVEVGVGLGDKGVDGMLE